MHISAPRSVLSVSSVVNLRANRRNDWPTAVHRDRYHVAMKGVILAGGSGSRLRPVTKVVNKHLLPVYDRPMVEHAVAALTGMGIIEIMIVTGADDVRDFQTVLGWGDRLGVRRLQFASQASAAGIADALSKAERFAAGDSMCVLLGDNLFGESLEAHRAAYEQETGGAMVLLKEVEDVTGLGVAELDGAGRLVRIVEKRGDGPGRLAVTGAYFYDASVFEHCRSIERSARGELEITDVNNRYAERGELRWRTVEGWWADAGTYRGLLRASRLAAVQRGEMLGEGP